jgi:hypothetical protein
MTPEKEPKLQPEPIVFSHGGTECNFDPYQFARIEDDITARDVEKLMADLGKDISKDAL